MKAKILVTFFHISQITATCYLVPSLRSPKSPTFYIYWFSVLISFFLYFLTSLCDPGRISSQKPVSTTKPEATYHQQQSSLGSILTATSGLNRPIPQPGTERKDNGESGEVYDFNPISEDLHHNDSQADSISINLDIIQDEDT